MSFFNRFSDFALAHLRPPQVASKTDAPHESPNFVESSPPNSPKPETTPEKPLAKKPRLDVEETLGPTSHMWTCIAAYCTGASSLVLDVLMSQVRLQSRQANTQTVHPHNASLRAPGAPPWLHVRWSRVCG